MSKGVFEDICWYIYIFRIWSSTVPAFTVSTNRENTRTYNGDTHFSGTLSFASFVLVILFNVKLINHFLFSGSINTTASKLSLYSYALRNNPAFSNKLCIHLTEYSICKCIFPGNSFVIFHIFLTLSTEFWTRQNTTFHAHCNFGFNKITSIEFFNSLSRFSPTNNLPVCFLFYCETDQAHLIL